MRHTYGQKGGEGPTAGKKAVIYTGTTPDGRAWKKRVFKELSGDTLIATGFSNEYDKPIVVVWPGEPEWEGNFGRMVATRQKD